jgi:GntR family transcriptional regulator
VSRLVDPMSDRPVFQQIADRLRADIAAGRLSEGEQLPSERTLMETFGAARGTVRQAVATLREQGLIDTEHGRGAFVRRRPPIRRVAHDRFARANRDRGKAAFLAEAEAEGVEPSVDSISVRTEVPPADVAEVLGVEQGRSVLVRRRRYLSDDEPVEVATSYLPLDLTEGTPIADENPGPGGIYARLEESGHRLARFTEDVATRMPLPDELTALRMRPGTPIFTLRRVAYDEGGRAVEVCNTVMTGDRFVLSYELPAH